MSSRAARLILLASCLGIIALIGVAAWYVPTLHSPVSNDEVRGLRRQTADLVRGWVSQGPQAMAREDGFVYTIDVGHLLIFAARSGDKDLYLQLRAFCVAHAIVDDPSESFTAGMVRWRCPADDTQPPEPASGTTEGLRVAQGLWLGAQAFERAEDRALALHVLRGYARHAYEDTTNGMWLIRNYCKLADKPPHCADNSYLLDYDPDFITQVAEATGDAALRDLAQRSLKLVRAGQAPCGLMYDLVEPAVKSLGMPDNLVICGPNDVVKLDDSATIAEHCQHSDPSLAQGVLSFALGHSGRLNVFYYGRSGAIATYNNPGLTTYATLVRLGVCLRSQRALDIFLPSFLNDTRGFLQNPRNPGPKRLYSASEILLTLQDVAEAMEERKP
jgi:hypothetical protein